MPIYAYRCESCGHSQDVLQKVSATPLTICPACGENSLKKQITAAGFQLKGSGWYVTDFRSKSSSSTPQEGTATAPTDAPAASAPDQTTETSAAPTAHTCGSGGCGTCS